MHISARSFKNILSISFDGKFDDDEEGYVDPEHDAYLIGLKIRFLDFLNKHYWHQGKPLGYDVLSAEILGPGSSGYPNCLEVLVGFFGYTDETHVAKFKDVLTTFKEDV